MNCVADDSMDCCLYLSMSIVSVNRRAGLFVGSRSASTSIDNSWAYDAGDVLKTACLSPSKTEVRSTVEKSRQIVLTFDGSQGRASPVQNI